MKSGTRSVQGPARLRRAIERPDQAVHPEENNTNMGLILTEDQLILRDMAKSFFDEKSPVERMRTLRDSRDETGFSRDLWKEMGELGWIGILCPESVGGADMGYGELGVVLAHEPRPLVHTLDVAERFGIDILEEAQWVWLADLASQPGGADLRVQTLTVPQKC